MNRFPCYAIGLMSGTSLDGVDAALMETDGESYVQTGMSLTVSHTAERRSDIRSSSTRQTRHMRSVGSLAT